MIYSPQDGLKRQALERGIWVDHQELPSSPQYQDYFRRELREGYNDSSRKLEHETSYTHAKPQQ